MTISNRFTAFFVKPAAAALAAVMVLGNTGPANEMVERRDSGHLIGNPAAEITLTEFISYSCSHCATFAREADGILELGYVGSGKMQLEIRPLVMNILDAAAVQAVSCADPKQFRQAHTAMMLAQPEWLAAARSATEAQQQRWRTGMISARLRSVAGDLDFYELMERHGVSRTQLDSCFADTKALDARVAASQAAFTEYPGLRGTPSFAVNGTLLEGAHSWSALHPKLDAAIYPGAVQPD